MRKTARRDCQRSGHDLLDIDPRSPRSPGSDSARDEVVFRIAESLGGDRARIGHCVPVFLGRDLRGFLNTSARSYFIRSVSNSVDRECGLTFRRFERDAEPTLGDSSLRTNCDSSSYTLSRGSFSSLNRSDAPRPAPQCASPGPSVPAEADDARLPPPRTAIGNAV